MKVSSIIEGQFPKDDESRPFPSSNIPLPITYQTPSMPSEGIFSLNFIFDDFVLVFKRLN
jgi:hypothetical protein